ncbi:MAG: hypothetical protein K9J16_15940 [Melioribacteraceae bacterium]|nr:hypothetical protein [Melioribacteraceae bacterium]MCF8394565.1 hypothetical protein [Melioribacteraceae bacterium]MCF8420224.1 hypothetical protein [Melioribacteraceae bacterium]
MRLITIKIILISLVLSFSNYAQVAYNFNIDANDLNSEIIGAEDGNSYVKLVFSDLSNSMDLGKPSLPIKFVNLIVPNNKEVADVMIHTIGNELMYLEQKIYPSQHQIPTGINDSLYNFVEPDSLIYNSTNAWPSQIVEVVHDGYFDGNNHIVTLKIIPFQYYPALNKIEILTKINIVLSFNRNNHEITLPSWRSVKTQKIIDKALESIVGNKQDIKQYQIKPKSHNFYHNNSELLNRPDPVKFYEYVIITSNSLKPYFDDFVAWKKRKGIDIGVVTTSTIYENYTGDYLSNIFDNAGKIRQYLRDLREVAGTWILFAGDYSILPIRYGCGWNLEDWTWIAPDDHKIPTDNYFADWNGNWNVDGDEFFGQPSDDSPDYWPEFFVGRLLCTNGSEVTNWAEKQLKYEQNPGNGDYTYLTRSFMMESDEMQHYDYAENVAANLPMFNHTIWRELPSYDAPDPYFPMGYEVINELNSTKYGLISWFGHGTPITVVASSDSVNTYPWNCVIPTNASGNNGSLDNLTNYNYPGIIYSISCINAPFDDYNPHNWGWADGYNLAEAYTVQSDAGGIAFLGNSRYGWIPFSYNLYQEFADQLNVGNTNLGVAELLSKANYISNYLEYSHNLIGDPEVSIWTETPDNFSSVSITDLGNRVIVTVSAPDDQNTICASSIDNGSTYWKVAHDVSSYVFNTSVRPLNITITRKNFLPYLATIGGPLNGSITLSNVNYLFGDFSNIDNGEIIIEPNSQIILEGGSQKTFVNKTILKGSDIKKLVPFIKGDITFVDDDSEIPDDFMLLGNYPNPFNPTTTIKYALPKKSDVKFEVFNLVGEKVFADYLPEQGPGYHYWKWNGKDLSGDFLSSGIYLYRLTYSSLDKSEVEYKFSKMILLK